MTASGFVAPRPSLLSTFLHPRAASRATLFRLLRRFTIMFAAALFAWAAPAAAQQVDSTMWVTNGPVYSIVPSGNTIYLGGVFSQIGPPTGCGVPLDATTGTPVAPYARISGLVSAAISDGAGGWFVGGDFIRVGGLPRAGLAHVLANGSVSPWNPGCDGAVNALALSGGKVYAGGMFSTVGGLSSTALAAIDASTGEVDPNFPGCDGIVYALAVSDTTLYVGGDFSLASGEVRASLAAVSTRGVVTAWDPEIGGAVFALAVSGGTVYAGGAFSTVGITPRDNLAAISASTGLATGWGPEPNGDVRSLALNGGTVYAGGFFSHIGGANHLAVAALSASSGFASSWDPAVEGAVLGLATNGSTVYIGGQFLRVGGLDRHNLAAVDATTGVPTPWDPNANGPAWLVALAGGTVFAGGVFGSLGGLDRTGLAAIDATTGQATAWDPRVNGSAYSMVASGDTIYAGGDFSFAGGLVRNSLAAFDANSGNLLPWAPDVESNTPLFAPVWTLAKSGGRIFFGGSFQYVNGQSRSFLAAVDAATGALDPWDPGPDSTVNCLALTGTTLYVGGEFSNIDGAPRAALAAIDLTGGHVTTWDPQPIKLYSDPVISSIAASGSLVYVGGLFTSMGGATRTNLAAVDATTGLATAWDPMIDEFTSLPAPRYTRAKAPAVRRVFTASPPGSPRTLSSPYGQGVAAIATSGDVVYIAGPFVAAGGQFRYGLAALNRVTGLATSWNPSESGCFGQTLAMSGSTIYVGGIFHLMGGRPLSNIARMQDSFTGTLVVRFDAETVDEGVRLRWQLAQSLSLTGAVIERAESESGPWIQPQLETGHEGELAVALDRSAAPDHVYWYRLRVSLERGEWQTFGPIRAETVNGLRESGLLALTPNPSDGAARVDFVVARREPVRLSVVDIGGREVEVLARGETDAGRYSLVWDGRHDGARVPAGIYFVRWQSPGRSMQRRLVIIR